MDNNKVKIFIFGRDNVNWALDKSRESVEYFLKENKFEITKNIFNATHIFCIWHELLLSPKNFWIQILRKVLSFKIIAVITNDISFYPEKLNKIKRYADVFIVPSTKLYNLLREEKMKVYKMPFFVNPKIFKSLDISKEEICKKLNIDWQLLRDKIIIGSFQRDSLGADLSKPKWQKNPDLLIRILEILSKEKFILLLAGPRRHYVINKCLEKKIPYLFYGDESYIQRKQDDIFVNNLSLEKINYLYNLIDVYLITSKSEGNPLQVSESFLTKTLIFSTKVGLVPDFLLPYLIFDEAKEACDKINKFFKQPSFFNDFIEKNYQKVKSEMDETVVKERYKKVILEMV